MACPVCEHTMHNVGVMPEPYTKVPLFWCPRCGTLKGNVVTEENESPSIVRWACSLLEDVSIPECRESVALEACCRLPQDRRIGQEPIA